MLDDAVPQVVEVRLRPALDSVEGSEPSLVVVVALAGTPESETEFRHLEKVVKDSALFRAREVKEPVDFRHL